MSRTLAPGDAYEAVSGSDPRGQYRVEVRSGEIIVGKTQAEVTRGHGETVDKYNRAKITVGERSESVWVFNRGDGPAIFDFVKSGFALDFVSSMTSETASERDERNQRVVFDSLGYQSVRAYDGIIQDAVFSPTAATPVDADNLLSDYPDASGIVLTGIDLYAEGQISTGQAQGVQLTIRLNDSESSLDWEATVNAADNHLSFGDGERPFAPLNADQPYQIEYYLSNHGAYNGSVRGNVSCRVIE